MSKIKSREKQLMNLDHQKYLTRISKTLYYGKLPKTDKLSLPVTELAAEIFSESKRGKSLDRLHCNEAAKISTSACISPCSLVLAMLYLDRLKTCNPEYLERTSPSDLFLVSVMVSSKFLFEDSDDDVYMKEWAESAGVTLAHLITLEREFLSAIEWNIYVSDLSFWTKLNKLEVTLAKREGKNRGYYTYTELEILLQSLDTGSFFQYLTGLTVLVTTAYTLGVLTILASMFLASQVPGTFLQQSKGNELEGNSRQVPVIETDIHTSELQIGTTVDVGDICKTCSGCEIETFDNEFNASWKNLGRNIDAVDVLKTGILLASIKPCSSSCCEISNLNDDTNSQKISWDWWSTPIMSWLSKVSAIVENLVAVISDKQFVYLETSISNMKNLQLQDQIHKATKTRIQDQMEGSWHQEWIDSLKAKFCGKPFAYLESNLKY